MTDQTVKDRLSALLRPEVLGYYLVIGGFNTGANERGWGSGIS